MRLAVTNQKGGVGKTTVAINVGGALAAAGERVLLVDLDPQGHLSAGVGLDDRYRASDTTTLTDGLQNPRRHELTDLVVSHEEFDVVPAHETMFVLEQDLVSAMRSRERLRQLLGDGTDYDWVLIDCPPSLGLLTDNALLAAQNVLIPAEAEDTSIRALELLLRQIQTLEDQFGQRVRERALVVSNVDYPLDNEQEGMREWFDDRFADRIPIHELRQRTAIKRAWNAGVSIFAHEEDCDQETALSELADDLLAQEETDE